MGSEVGNYSFAFDRVCYQSIFTLVCASGGARMQEGSLILMQMAIIYSALLYMILNRIKSKVILCITYERWVLLGSAITQTPTFHSQVKE